MSRSGAPCDWSGVYRTTCLCAMELPYMRGEPLPDCPRCDRPVSWVFVRELGSRRAAPGSDARPALSD